MSSTKEKKGFYFTPYTVNFCSSKWNHHGDQDSFKQVTVWNLPLKSLIINTWSNFFFHQFVGSFCNRLIARGFHMYSTPCGFNENVTLSLLAFHCSKKWTRNCLKSLFGALKFIFVLELLTDQAIFTFINKKQIMILDLLYSETIQNRHEALQLHLTLDYVINDLRSYF